MLSWTANAGSLPHRIVLYGLLAPFVVGTLVLVGLPIAITIALAFVEYDTLGPPVFVGVDNFTGVLQEKVFHTASWNSFIYVAAAVPLRMAAALGLALALQERRRMVSAYRASAFLPTVIPDVAYALIWLWILNPLYGPLNLALKSLGFAGHPWLVDPGTALGSIVFMALFQIGEGFVLMLVALRAIPQDTYDAAAIDGATGFVGFRSITLPLIAPWMFLLFVRDVVITLQSSFVATYLMTGGGPYYATFLLPALIYEEGFDRFRFGLAAAMMLIVFAVVSLLILLVWRLLRRWTAVDEV